MKVRQLELFQANLPFRFSFKHAASQRVLSESLFVKITLDDGITGWGEALPRPYVTGETAGAAFDALQSRLAPIALGTGIAKPQDVYDLASKLNGEFLPGEESGAIYFGAARCALEIALLDAAGKTLRIPFHEWLGPLKRRAVHATAVVPEISPSKLSRLLWLIRLACFRALKIKVGTDRDEENLSLVRKILGPDIPLTVDANGAWTAAEAVEKLLAWRRFGINAVEQPVAARDFAGMRRVLEETGVDVMADESLRSLQDAETLIDVKACSVFNIRISKCGGMLNSWRMLKLAASSGIRCQIGCQVGESSVLAAAGAWLGLCADAKMPFEGGYGRLLLKEDVAAPRVSLGWRGKVRPPHASAGLGVEVHPALLEKVTERKAVVA